MRSMSPTESAGPFQIPQGVPVVAIAVDEYLGVTSSTRTLFTHTISPPTDMSAATVKELASALLDLETRHFVLSGWSPSRLELARRLAKAGARVDALWHGNYLQTREDYNWDMFRGVIELARDGIITKVGVVKTGMETWLEGLGVRAAFLLNYVPDIPQGPATPEPGGPHIGLWLVAEGYRKLPYAMLAAVGMVDGAVIAGTGMSERALEFARFVGIDTTRLLTSALPHRELMLAVSRTHLSLYVTQSECGPMLPLESLSVGVPCLIGPNSHLFADDDFLASTLIVPYPDHAEVIAWHIRDVLEKRADIVEAYRRYAPSYIARARASVDDFLAP